MNRTILFFATLFIISYSPIVGQENLFEKSPSRYIYDDSISYMDRDFDDSKWNILYDIFIYGDSSIVSVRTEIFINQNLLESNQISLLLDIGGNHEVFWNGKKLGQNFEGDLTNTEDVGDFEKTYLIDSNYKVFENNILGFRTFLQSNETIEIETILIDTSSNFYSSSIYTFGYLFFLFIIYLTILYLLSFKFTIENYFFKYFLIFTVLVVLLSLIVEFLLFQNVLNYYASEIVFYMLEVYALLLMFSISLFFFIIYKIPNYKIYSVLLFLILLTIKIFQLETYIFIFTGIIPSLVILLMRYKNRDIIFRNSIIFLLFICVVSFAWQGIKFSDIGYLVLLFYISSEYLIKHINREKEINESQLRSSRLESEMLKKIIQPHYIMNSMNSVVDLIEESPNKVLGFIKDLTQEFRIFLNFSNKKFVTISEEIELCRKHLSIMEYRQIREFNLETEIKNPYKSIPPVILHTLIENGVTHNSKSTNKICLFIKEYEVDQYTTIFVSVNYNDNCNSNINLDDKRLSSLDEMSEGTGIKYIKSRLAESYKNDWFIEYYNKDDLWITKIKFPTGA